MLFLSLSALSYNLCRSFSLYFGTSISISALCSILPAISHIIFSLLAHTPYSLCSLSSMRSLFQYAISLFLPHILSFAIATIIFSSRSLFYLPYYIPQQHTIFFYAPTSTIAILFSASHPHTYSNTLFCYAFFFCASRMFLSLHLLSLFYILLELCFILLLYFCCAFVGLRFYFVWFLFVVL